MKTTRNRIEEVLETVGLRDRAEDKVRKYSRGMRQRLAIANALLSDPEVFILDEPATGLDPSGVRDIRDVMVTLRQNNKTVFFSSHSLSEVEKICDEVAIISKGKLVASGQLASLMSGPAAVHAVVDDVDKALRIASEKGWEAKREGSGVSFHGVEAGQVNQALVAAGLVPSELRASKRELEDFFLDLTDGGDRNDD
jgi:ABC-2 type transport system ATP-binding protein